MKTIEEQAREYAIHDEYDFTPSQKYGEFSRSNIKHIREQAFLAGAKAATRWIPVEEEPKDRSKPIISLDKNGCIDHNFYGSIVGHNQIIQYDSKDPSAKFYTHWLPMPPKPEK